MDGSMGYLPAGWAKLIRAVSEIDAISAMRVHIVDIPFVHVGHVGSGTPSFLGRSGEIIYS